MSLYISSNNSSKQAPLAPACGMHKSIRKHELKTVKHDNAKLELVVLDAKRGLRAAQSEMDLVQVGWNPIQDLIDAIKWAWEAFTRWIREAIEAIKTNQ